MEINEPLTTKEVRTWTAGQQFLPTLSFGTALATSVPPQTAPPDMNIIPTITDTSKLSEHHLAKAAELRLVQDDGLIVDIRKTNGTRLGSFVIGVDDAGKTFIVRDYELAEPEPLINDRTTFRRMQITVEAICRQP